MDEIVFASIGAVILVLLLVWYFGFRSSGGPVTEPAPTSAPVGATATDASKPAITFTTVVAATSETADKPALPGTTVITTPLGSVTQYGDETPVSASEDEHFQPYMSVLANDVYRSDASFDVPLSKPEPEIYGNYI